MTNRISNNPAVEVRLEHDSFGRLVLIDAGGTHHVGVEPIRGFPISAPETGLSLCDSDGHELVWIDDWRELSAAMRAIIEAELARREFVPQIRRIVSVSLQTDPCQWEVETDRGPTRFVLKSDNDIRRIAGGRAIVTDAHGIRYLIPDTKSLDRASRRILERYL